MAHWRNTYKPVRFFFLDVRVGVIILLSMLHIRIWTIGIDLMVIAAAWYIDRIGLGFAGALRALRASMTGEYRPAHQYTKIRRKVDFEFRRLPWQSARETGSFHLQPVKKDDDPDQGSS